MAAIAGRLSLYRGDHDGAIAQLGERVVRNDEVGGSIPPGSTTLRPSGSAWRSHKMPEGRSVGPGEAQRAKDGLIIVSSGPPYSAASAIATSGTRFSQPSRKC